jgi:hypothetical protein
LNLARCFSYTRQLEHEIEKRDEIIQGLMSRVPELRKPFIAGTSAADLKKPELVQVMRRPMARDYIRNQEQELARKANEPKSNVPVAPEVLEAT